MAAGVGEQPIVGTMTWAIKLQEDLCQMKKLGIPLTQVRKDDTFGKWKKQV